ncbi:hypothetical protein AB0C02_29160 [Micromonospora sp. NPDC048999]|uniref:hypothetical protein n=1 Tax=Micromonospora sp. NPDC048999 TaxID=3155391 RepID=UPI00340CD604
MEPERDVRISEHIPPASRGTLVLSDALLGRSESAAIVLRSMVGYDEGIKIETEFLLRRPGVERRPLRDALNPQNADPAISFGSGTAGDFRPLTWNDAGGTLNISTLSADEGHSRLTIRTWINPAPDELVVGVRWLAQDIQPTQLRVDCRHVMGSWSVPLWSAGVDQMPG